MTDLARNLERIGLSQYLDSFIDEGFDTWDTVLYITESDLDALNVRLGHRRRLQREIASERKISFDSLIHQIGTVGNVDSAQNVDGIGGPSIGTPTEGTSPAANASGKRKYRRHPKPDTHAPDRPPSAYVIFSNAVREEVKKQNLTFSDIAKTVGERWQNLVPEEKKRYESEAAAFKEDYNIKLAQYKKTAEYREYQVYLNEFKAKNASASADNKRPKMEKATSSGSAGSVSSGQPPGPPGGASGTSSQARRRTESTGGYRNSPSGSVHGSPTPGLSKPYPPPPIEASSPSSTATTPLTAAGNRLSISSQSNSGPPTRLQSLPRIVPLESDRDSGAPSATLPPIITEPSRMSYSYRRTANTSHAPLLHHDTSRSSMSSNLSSNASTNSAFTPITPLDENRSLSSTVQHGPTGNYVSHNRPLSWTAVGQPPSIEPVPISHSTENASPFHLLSISEQLVAEPHQQGLSYSEQQHSADSQYDRSNSLNISGSDGRRPEQELGKSNIDALSVLALAGRIVDRENSQKPDSSL